MQTSLWASLLMVLAVAAIFIGQVHPAVAPSATSTYVLGVTNLTDPLVVDLQNLTSSLSVLPGVSSLTLVGTNSILFVDGQWLQTAASLDSTVLSLVAGKALAGVPTIVVRGSPALLADSISGLVKSKAIGLPLISEGVQVFGTLSDGTRQAMTLQVISGFNYAVQAEFKWAQQLLSQPVVAPLLQPIPLQTILGFSRSTPRLFAQTAPAPYWAFVGAATISTGDQYDPVARTSYTISIYSLQNSGSSTNKWYNFFLNKTIQPGSNFYDNSNWRTVQELDFNRAVNQTSNLFVDHGPQLVNTPGPTQITYRIGVKAGALGASATANQTGTYFLPSRAVVTDISQDMFNVGWRHDMNSGPGENRQMMVPGWTDRLPIAGRIDTQGTFTTTFADYGQNEVRGQSRSITMTLGVFGG